MAGRDLPDRSTDYRDQPTDRYRGPPRDSRDKDHDFKRNEAREADRSAPRNHGRIICPVNGNDEGMADSRQIGQRTPPSMPGGRSASRCEFQVGMELIGEMSAVRGELIKADARLNKAKRELNISGSRPVEFASVGELKRKELERYEEEVTRQERKLAQIYPKLQAEFDLYLRTSANPATQPGTPTHTRNQPDLEPRLMELHRSITTLGENRLQSEVAALQEVINEVKQKKQVLADELEVQKRKNQTLEEKVNNLELMFRTIKPAVEVQISSEIDKQISPRMRSLEDNLNKGLSNNVEATRQLQTLVDDHAEQLVSLTSQCSAGLVAGLSSTTVAQTPTPNVEADMVRLQGTLDMHVRNINFMQKEKLEPALSKIRDLERAVEQSTKDSQHAKALAQVQSSLIKKQDQKQISLEEKFGDQAEKQKDLDTNFARLYSEQLEEHKALDNAIASLESNAESFRGKTESIEANVASLDATIKGKLQIEDGQASDLAQLQLAVNQQQKRTDELGHKLNADLAQLQSIANKQQKRTDELGQKLDSASSASIAQASEISSLQSSVKKQQGRSDSLEKTVTCLKSEIQDFEKVIARIQAYPPAADLDRILAEVPSGKDTKMLIADVSKLRESVSKLKSCKTLPLPPSNPNSLVTKETITQTVDSRIVQLDIATKKQIDVLFENLAKIIDGLEKRTEQSITYLNGCVSKLHQGLNESKEQTEMAKEVGESRQKRCNEQAAELRKEMRMLVDEEVNKLRSGTRNELEDVQFRVEALAGWAMNLNTKEWHDSVAQHIASYVPAHFNRQLDGLAIRVSSLETRSNDSEGANKRRRIASGNPSARNGAF
ncbi:hypothetical protein FSPOR_8169 [Fusarium sporotrichioides]|uniref:Uncharacterized protein n=1 Tax=Fusarium sporotrichioides TaxID=5514 RepID=A0A395RVL0_FUSSP|nr:hypothetical protein FSPOR_8169 [Fusarium sporotrichioides]